MSACAVSQCDRPGVWWPVFELLEDRRRGGAVRVARSVMNLPHCAGHKLHVKLEDLLNDRGRARVLQGFARVHDIDPARSHVALSWATEFDPGVRAVLAAAGG